MNEVNVGASSSLEVRKTANDAIISKQSAVQRGYYKDDFIRIFAHPAMPTAYPQDVTVYLPSATLAPGSLPTEGSDSTAFFPQLPSLRPESIPGNAFHARRSPLINRGYYSRVSGIDKLIKQFLRICDAQGLPSQIVSCGAGFDCSYWRLKFHHHLKATRYIEIDFRNSIEQKLVILDHNRVLLDVIHSKDGKLDGANNVDTCCEQNEPDAEILFRKYHDFGIVSGDLGDTAQLEHRLKLAGADFSIPTLFISECVMVYMDPVDSDRFVEFVARGPFTGHRLLVVYEQIHPDDAFGRTMMSHLANRGCPLYGLLKYPDLLAQRHRMLSRGFDLFGGWTMNDVYLHWIDSNETRATEKLELFDEFEEWHLIQGHYSINIGYAAPQEQKEALNNTETRVFSKESDAFHTFGFLQATPPRL